MGKSLKKKVLSILGSSAIGLSLGMSGASAFGKDVIIPGVGIVFLGVAISKGVAFSRSPNFKQEKISKSRTGYVKLAPRKCLSDEQEFCTVDGGRVSNNCIRCGKNDLSVAYRLKSKKENVWYPVVWNDDGYWIEMKGCDACINKANMTLLKFLVRGLISELKSDDSLSGREVNANAVKCALISLVSKRCFNWKDEEGKRIVREATPTLFALDFGRNLNSAIQRTGYLDMLTDFLSKSESQKNRAVEIVKSIYNLDREGFDNYCKGVVSKVL